MPVDLSLSYDMPGEGKADLPQSAAEAEAMYRLPTGSVQALERAERSGDQSVSPKEARGRMQFIPSTWAQYGMGRDITNGPASYDAAARYMKDLLGTYNGNVDAAHAHYNGGGKAGQAVAMGKEPPAEETRNYLKNTRAFMKSLQAPEGKVDLTLPKAPVDLTLPKQSPPPPGLTGAYNMMGTALKEPQSDAGKAAAKAAAESALPALAGLAVMGPGAEAGAALGAAVGSIVPGPGTAIGAAVGGFAGAAAANLGGSYIMGRIQDHILGNVPDTVLRTLGMDPQTRAKERQEHPYASLAGSMSTGLLGFKPGVQSIRQAAMMFGLGGSFEVGQEYLHGDALDPIKIVAAGLGQAVLQKPTALGRAVMFAPKTIFARGPAPTSSAERVEPTMKPTAQAARQTVSPWDIPKSPRQAANFGPLEPPLDSIAPRNEYAAAVRETLGPQWVAESMRYYNDIRKAFGPMGPLPSAAPVQSQVNHLQDYLYRLNGYRTSDRVMARQLILSLPENQQGIARSEDMYHLMPDEVNHGRPMTPEQRQVYADVFLPLQQQIQHALFAAKVVGGADPALLDINVTNPRTLNTKWLTKVAAATSDPTVPGGFAARAGSLNERSMVALEYADGTRRVVRRNGMSFEGFDSQGKPMGNIATHSTHLSPDGSVTFPDAAGQPVRLVQAHTAEIEAQTPYRYNKDALANHLATLQELRAYTRERTALKSSLQMLQNAGAAIPVSRVPTAPNGFSRISGDRTLNHYYIHDRFAEAFKDSVLQSGGGIAGKINQAVVGTMFWNPWGHLSNTFDHFYSSIGWDAMKPWQWKSLAQDFAQSYRDVTQLTPEYQRFLQHGVALQYGNVMTQDFLRTLMQGIPRESWDQIAVRYGTKPSELYNDFMQLSRRVLWGGSDIFMMSAYRHAASAKGMNVFNQAIQNYVEAHNPNYRIPTRIGMDSLMKIPGMPEAFATAISRNASLLMQSKTFNMFGRYHYGQFKSVGADLHDAVMQNHNSVQTRGEALSHMAFVGFNMFVVYPFLWDQLAKFVSGNPDAQMRRAGSTTIPTTVWHMALGDQTVRRLISEAWSLPPVTKALFELPSNMNLFTGKHIWEPGDSIGNNTRDVADYMEGLYAPAGTYEQLRKQEKLTTREKFASAAFGVRYKPDTLSDKQKKYLAQQAAAKNKKMHRSP